MKPLKKQEEAGTDSEQQAQPNVDLVAISGFFRSCHFCTAPVKREWKRCPGCKAKILEPGERPPDAAFEAPGTDKELSNTAEGAVGAMPMVAGAIRIEEFTMECSNPDCRAPGIHCQKHAT
jgi:hypothetical protein